MPKCKYKEMCGFDFCTEEDCPEYKPAQETNGDLIRAMSDKELGEFLCDNMTKDCGICPGAKYCSEGRSGLIKWLGLPAEED